MQTEFEMNGKLPTDSILPVPNAGVLQFQELDVC
jgi:hypothetical protein